MKTFKNIFLIFNLFFFFNLCTVFGQYTIVSPSGEGQSIPGTGQCFQLTDNQTNGEVATAIWSNTTVNLQNDLDFMFTVFLGNADGADGIAFVLQDQGASAIGGGGGYLGFSDDQTPIQNSLAVEIDTYNNGNGFGDIAQDHFSLVSNGNMGTPIVGPQFYGNLEDGAWHTFRVTISPNCVNNLQTINVFCDGNLVINTTQNFIQNVFGGNSIVTWGFTGGTWSQANTQQFCVNTILQTPPTTQSDAHNDNLDSVSLTHSTEPCTPEFASLDASQLIYDMNTQPIIQIIDTDSGATTSYQTNSGVNINALGGIDLLYLYNSPAFSLMSGSSTFDMVCDNEYKVQLQYLLCGEDFVLDYSFMIPCCCSDLLNVQISGNLTVCEGQNNGSIIVQGPYELTWLNTGNGTILDSNGFTVLDGIGLGVYTVHIYDLANSCEDKIDITISIDDCCEECDVKPSFVAQKRKWGYMFTSTSISSNPIVSVTWELLLNNQVISSGTGNTFSYNNIENTTLCITVTDSQGCEQTECLFYEDWDLEASLSSEVNNSGLEGDFSKNVELYPNPSNGYVYVNFPENVRRGSVKISILNVQGQLVHATQLANIEDKVKLNLENLSDGIYWMKATSADGISWQQKIVLTR